VYQSPSSKLTYQLDTGAMDFLEAEDFCVASYGAHLVSFANHSEQAEVEGYFARVGEARPGLCVPLLMLHCCGHAIGRDLAAAARMA
jgi:hypothetical protein